MTKEEGTERTRLKAARIARGLSQAALAAEIKCGQRSIAAWEGGESDPHSDYILALCVFFDKNPAELDLAKILTESELAMLQDILKNRTVDRRQALAIVTAPAFAGVDLSSLSTSMGPMSSKQFLKQCNATINACWQLMKHGGFAEVQNVLAEYFPTLSDLADVQSDYQKMAASLAVEATFLQIILAGHKLDFVGRGICCSEAVRFGRLSGNKHLYVIALGYLGRHHYLYISDPKKATASFDNALATLNSDTFLQVDTSLLRSITHMGLSGAYSQDKEEKHNAIDNLEQAKILMPKHPRLDPLYRLIDIGPSEFSRLECEVYLNLHKHFPKEGYGRMAYETLEHGVNKQAISDRTESEILICQADAARAIGDLNECIKCLKKGLTIAFQINSPKRKSEAQHVLDNVPDKWKIEQRYKKLLKMF